jgi:hypothetical protein
MFALMRQTRGHEWTLLVYIANETVLAPEPREYADIPIWDLQRLCGASERTIHATLTRMEKKGWIGRRYPMNKTCRGPIKITAPIGQRRAAGGGQ